MTKDSIRAYISQYIDADRIQGASIGIVQGDKSWTAHFGQLSDTDSELANDQTLYEIGSITKVFTGILLAAAVGDQSLRLDQPIGSIATELENSNPSVAQSINLLHLATHQSGLNRMPKNFRPADPDNPYADYSRQLLFDYMKKATPPHAPGTGQRYSNLGFGLLGELLAVNAGTQYESLLSSAILMPLGMTDTSINLSDSQLRRFAPPHTEGLERTSAWLINGLSGAGAIRSTVSDMTLFMKATLVADQSELGRSMDLAWEQHLAADGEDRGMGLGWIIARDGETRFHAGKTGGFRSAIFVNRKIRSGVIVLANTATDDVTMLGEAVMRMLLGIKPPKLKPVYSVDVSEVDMLRLVGRYKISPNFAIDIRLNKGWLIAQATNQRSFRINPKSAARWERTDLGAEVKFDLPDEGTSPSFTLYQGGREMKAQRVNE